MKIPKYVQDLMERSRYEFDFYTSRENYSAGYTIKIRKRSAYQQIDTFQREITQLVKWANKAAGIETAYILDMPTKNHYCNQVAVVTIFDPIMQKIEQYIPQ